MGQRKLTRDEMLNVNRAAWYLRSVMNHCGIIDHGASVVLQLDAMESHGTTDGKPYVEPQPEIGEGYRRATEADVERRDLEFFSKIQGNIWVRRARGNQPLLPNYRYRVPVDRIPTDEDAKQRPIVMVRDDEDSQWKEKKLLGVAGGHFPFVVVTPDFKPGYYESSQWRLCRFPYTGELD